ncbi:MAG: BON domain-containing protein [Pseudomonadota bacterium]|nr:BON domain-containing protein [Pseudomonadota bacterium]
MNGNNEGRNPTDHDDRGDDGRQNSRNDNEYAQRPYENMRSVTNRDWGSREQADPQASFGPPELGGYGDFRSSQDSGGRTEDREPRDRGQGGYGEDQGRYAQSGHGRGGSVGNAQGNVSRGPVGAGSQDQQGRGHRGRGPKSYTRPDTSIADEIYSRLTDDDAVDATQILVMVDDAEVTLTGEVPERQMKHRAEDLVDAVRGIKEIHNRIRVDRGADSFGPPGAAVRSGQDQIGSGFSS